jgi:hypothetical protein
MQHTYTHTDHTYILEYIHTYTHTYIHTWVHTQEYIHTGVRTYIHMPYIHTYTHTYTHRAYIHTGLTYTHTSIHKYRSYIHTDHTHAHMHVYIPSTCFNASRSKYKANIGLADPSALHTWTPKHVTAGLNVEKLKAFWIAVAQHCSLRNTAPLAAELRPQA